jgi:hypothetical protein
MACPDQVVRFQPLCMTALGATAGMASEAPPVGEAGHWMTSGAGERYSGDECGRWVLQWQRQLSMMILALARQ